MEFDFDYYDGIEKFFNEKDGITYDVAELTDTPDRFILHAKAYIERQHRRPDLNLVVVEFNSDYSKLKVYEFFEGIVAVSDKPIANKNFNPNLIPPYFWNLENKPKQIAAQATQQPEKKSTKSTNTLFK